MKNSRKEVQTDFKRFLVSLRFMAFSPEHFDTFYQITLVENARLLFRSKLPESLVKIIVILFKYMKYWLQSLAACYYIYDRA